MAKPYVSSVALYLEIPVATQILEAFDVAGKVVTTDALLTQRTFCQNLCDADADYALPVKANQKSLLDDLNLSHRKPKQQPNRQRHSKKHTMLSVHPQLKQWDCQLIPFKNLLSI